jgi:hypothetical protein
MLNGQHPAHLVVVTFSHSIDFLSTIRTYSRDQNNEYPYITSHLQFLELASH